jgi:hypothetical protein
MLYLLGSALYPWKAVHECRPQDHRAGGGYRWPLIVSLAGDIDGIDFQDARPLLLHYRPAEPYRTG